MLEKLVKTISEDTLTKKTFDLLSDLIAIEDTNMQCNLDLVNTILKQRPGYFGNYTALIFWAYDPLSLMEDYRVCTDIVIVDKSYETESTIDFVYHITSGKILSIQEMTNLISKNWWKSASNGFSTQYKYIVQNLSYHNDRFQRSQPSSAQNDTSFFVSEK